MNSFDHADQLKVQLIPTFRSRVIDILVLSNQIKVYARADLTSLLKVSGKSTQPYVVWSRSDGQTFIWHSRCSTIKISPTSKAMSADPRPKF